MIATFNGFEIEMTKIQAASASRPGVDASPDVDALLATPKIKRQLDKIPASDIRTELKEIGAWDEAELADDAANRERIVWIAAGDIYETARFSK